MSEAVGDAGPKQIWPSVDDLCPTEEGGPSARTGFTYQDEIVVGFLIEMLEDVTVLKVHCETHEDAIVIRQDATSEALIAEYAQVKAEEPDQLWTVALLCEKKKTPGSSLFETSLGRDKHSEIAHFRIVTLRQPAKALKPLTYPFKTEARVLKAEEMVALRAEIEKRFPNVKSAKGNDCGYWLQHCRWDVRNEYQAVVNENRRRLMTLAVAAGCSVLLLDQLDTLLEDLRQMAKVAGDAKWKPDRAKKIITRGRVTAWWAAKLEELAEGARRVSGGRLAEKLEAASLPAEIIALALDLRLDYAAAVRTPRYQESEEVGQLQRRVKSDALTLRTRLVSGALEATGPVFHALCVERMDAINASRPKGLEDQSAFLKGCLYDIADRCLLRFEPPSA
ncbi:Hypothetical protein GbCGDNIH6_8221 [Granulibacter bethesdensis]|uniref:dsDNA nuclease domain-containing protein n=1 Tax=Granulibacter bethesdensis TaxID=364410 RepID=UPI000909E4F5|nr:dsDNA nuclease domain-containing protein [Granulibacter bethesdensis]APH56871.1 Hypothetical protein GbCGDNIH6_8221 [Granulibacter bethesdensis]